MTPDQLLPSESGMDLPPPVAPKEKETVDSPEPTPVLRQGSEVNPEFLPPVSNQQNPQPQPAAQATQTQPLVPPPATPTATGATTQQSSHANPVLAEDVDLIEKEWVDKAKAIVNHTKDDPYRQNHEINKMKADYIKKRYNKDVQVSE
jgi:hypothetical protein